MSPVSRARPSLDQRLGVGHTVRAQPGRPGPSSPVSGVMGRSWRTRSLMRTLWRLACLGEPVAGPHPAVEGGRARRHAVPSGRSTSAGSNDGQAGQGLGVDRRWTWRGGTRTGACRGRLLPRAPGRPDGPAGRRRRRRAARPDRSAPSPPRARVPGAAPSKAACLQRRQALGRRDGLAFGHHPARRRSSTRTVCSLAMPRSRPMMRRSAHVQPPVVVSPLPAARRWSAPSRHGPKETPPGGGSHSCAATGPGLMDRATSLIRVIRGQAEWWQSDSARPDHRGVPSLRSGFVATPQASRDDSCNLGTAARWWIHRPESLT